MTWDLPPKIWLPPKPAIVRPAPVQKANFLPGMFPGLMMVAAAASPPPTLTYVTNAISAANLTTYTFSSVDIGAADATRYVIVSVYGLNTATISSASIGGISADIIEQRTNDGLVTGLIGASVPTGTTADIVVTFSTGQQRSGIGVWQAINLASTTPTDTATDIGTSLTLDVNVLDDGFVVAAAHDSGDPNFSWSGATARFDVSNEGSTDLGGADESGLSAATPYALSCSVISGSNGTGVAASFR
jgi:hypothetical protein